MRLTELLALEVVAEDGRHLGHIVELCCADEPEHGETREHRIISEFLYGRVGWLEKLGLKSVEERAAPWSAVQAIKDGKIVLRASPPQR